MKRSVLIILLIALVALCGCSMPLKPVQTPSNTIDKTSKYTVYVSGAVVNDGYITVDAGSDYYSLLDKAGLLDCSAMIEYSSSTVNGNITEIIVNYKQGNRTFYSVNVNGTAVVYKLSVENVSASVVNKLANYIEFHGFINNRDELYDALGDDYADNYYKFFIDIQDYA